MAEIPVEKRSGSKNWLWILLALLVLALLAWWLLNDDGDDVVEYTENDAVATATAPAAAGALVAGEQIDMENAEVTLLAGDMAFYVERNGEQVPVFFDEVPTPGTPMEGQYDINPGDVLNITGEVRSSTDELPEGADPSFLGSSQNYIFATNVEQVG